MDNNSVRYKHDCVQCVFLGQYQEFDLYYCSQSGYRTVVARFGEGSDYHSGLIFRDFFPPLKEAFDRAVEIGLTDKE